MDPFTVLKSKATPLDRVNVDTDQIVPKQFLKLVKRTGFGKYLFYDWRFDRDGKPRSDFVLNNRKYSGRQIMLARDNFGSGSSREHAAWAILDYGFRAVIAPSFADIFANNCPKNGVLAVVLSEQEVAELLRRAGEFPKYQVKVDLDQLRVTDERGFSASFTIDDFTRHCLLEGLDDIGLTMQHEREIAAYEARHPLPSSAKHLGP